MAAGGDDTVPAFQNGSSPAAAAPSSAGKPKRVRTGCLTCRERHLKCDEGQPICMNCRKSQRACKRGVRLNFIDTTCQAPPESAPIEEWSISFQDESLDIASEYKGGVSKYRSSAVLPPTEQFDSSMNFDLNTATLPTHHALPNHVQPPVQNTIPEAPRPQYNPSPQENLQIDHPNHRQSSQSVSSSTPTNGPMLSYDTRAHLVQNTDDDERRELINDPNETLYMQVFVEEVGLWMDSMDPAKTFSRILPFHALGQPMLMNGFLACGVRHLTLVNPTQFSDETAVAYYDKASRQLLNALQNPNRDSIICATTAVILNVYEIMTEKPLQRMSHIAGSRALIRECGWDATTQGVGGACFWMNVGLETLSNIRFNWKSAWEPDKWGVDMNMIKEAWPGREEMWTHRMLYIIAKISDFRAGAPKAHELNGPSGQMLREQRYQEWLYLRSLCDAWNENIPRTMHLMAYLYPYQTRSGSAFPEIWLIKRTTIVAQLFYNTAMCLLARTNPLAISKSPEMQDLDKNHAHIICGIAAHVKDRGVASVALRSLNVAAETLTNRREQEEVLEIFARIHRETGWRIGFIPRDLRRCWGWHEATPPSRLSNKTQLGESNFDQFGTLKPQASQVQASTPPPQQMPPQGIVNPMFAQADFSQPRHPYQDYYVAPVSSANQLSAMGLPLPVAPGSYGYPSSFSQSFGQEAVGSNSWI